VIEYSHSAGNESYRRKLAESYRKIGIDVDHTEIIVTTGGSEAVLFAFMSCFNPGDEVMVAEPCFTAYFQQVEFNGGVVVPVPSRAENGFFPTAEDFEKAITPRTKILVINSPCNPTGGVITLEQAQSIAEVAKKHDLFVISDEIYEAFVFSGKHIPMASLPGMKERAMTIGGFLKSHCMTGRRIGYVTAPWAPFLSLILTLRGPPARECISRR